MKSSRRRFGSLVWGTRSTSLLMGKAMSAASQAATRLPTLTLLNGWVKLRKKWWRNMTHSNLLRQVLFLTPIKWLNFRQGVANRGASIRVGRDTEKEGKGYFEDRRPASNMDPYVVTSMIAETTILWKPWAPQLSVTTRKRRRTVWAFSLLHNAKKSMCCFRTLPSLTLDIRKLSGHF